MTKKSDYREAMNEAGYGEPSRPNWMCHVVGCPLAGCLSASTTGTNEWFCRLHFGAPAALWADISARASNRHALLQVAQQLSQSGANAQVSDAAVRTIKGLKRDDLLSTDGKRITTAKALGRHIFGKVEQEIKHPELQPQMSVAEMFADEVEA
jgi:hypothetical protein